MTWSHVPLIFKKQPVEKECFQFKLTGIGGRGHLLLRLKGSSFPGVLQTLDLWPAWPGVTEWVGHLFLWFLHYLCFTPTPCSLSDWLLSENSSSP